MTVYTIKSPNNNWTGADIFGIFLTEQAAKDKAEFSALLGKNPEETLLEWDYPKGELTLTVDAGLEFYIIEEFELK